jgi:hypothetical protein
MNKDKFILIYGEMFKNLNSFYKVTNRGNYVSSLLDTYDGVGANKLIQTNLDIVMNNMHTSNNKETTRAMNVIHETLIKNYVLDKYAFDDYLVDEAVSCLYNLYAGSKKHIGRPILDVRFMERTMTNFYGLNKTINGVLIYGTYLFRNYFITI